MHETVAYIRDLLKDADLQFTHPPVIVGGRAMEYYGLRQSGEDVDLVITDDDYQRLAKSYPDKRKDIWGDLGVVLWPFEIWRSIMYFDYQFFLQDAVRADGLCIVSMDRLLLTRVYAMDVEKYRNDLVLIKKKYLEQYGNGDFLALSHARAHIYEKQPVILGGKYEV
ncbi:hypothetical protein LJC74_10450 [Eubacteriales bacterium OttesenSCG-928-A19]|nr:hypothetical protein [Eubacteriales bacterium OttesenSCG-928-A19]